MLELASRAFFHVSVMGKLVDVTDPMRKENRQGKAFAVGHNLLITSQHVVGEPGEWKPRNDGRANEVLRAVRPLERDVKLHQSGGPSDELADPIVLPTLSYNADAAGLSLPNLKLEKYFDLSICGIDPSRNYSTIMTSDDDPADPKSIDKPVIVELAAAGYEPKTFGALYVFDTVGNPDFKGEPEGHDGSPIFDDEDGTVVAVVSAVITGGSGHRILATPIQPMFPGASALLARAPDASGAAAGSLKCSLSDTVKRINDQVVAHANWSLKVEREPDGTPNDEIYLHYDSVADKPNIDNIKIQYDFWGKQRASSNRMARLPYAGSEANQIELKPDSGPNDRQFSTTEVVLAGKKQLETLLKEKKEGGYIDYVEVTIFYTHLVDGRELDREIILDFKWKQP
ncbi:hypothetical protein [Mesorhizobium sp.]|uniref:hypothetical protein n=1 Tax=Mesorhizobium sp. TaxID=1871066 RepID=UPI0025797154|nr:hypothetical protein [Mesorhizobium sp.]